MGSPAALASVNANGNGLSSRAGRHRGGDGVDGRRRVIGVSARGERDRDRRAVQQRAGDRADHVTPEDAVAGTPDDDQIRRLLGGEIDQRPGEGLTDQHRGGCADTSGGQGIDGPRDPILATLDEQLLVFGTARMAVGQLLAHHQDDVDVGVERLGERAGQGDSVVAGRGGQIPDGQMHCWSCSFSRRRGP